MRMSRDTAECQVQRAELVRDEEMLSAARAQWNRSMNRRTRSCLYYVSFDTWLLLFSNHAYSFSHIGAQVGASGKSVRDLYNRHFRDICTRKNVPRNNTHNKEVSVESEKREVSREENTHYVCRTATAHGLRVEPHISSGGWQYILTKRVTIEGHLCAIRLVRASTSSERHTTQYARIVLNPRDREVYQFVLALVRVPGSQHMDLIVPTAILDEHKKGGSVQLKRISVNVPLTPRTSSFRPTTAHRWLTYVDAWHLLKEKQK